MQRSYFSHTNNSTEDVLYESTLDDQLLSWPHLFLHFSAVADTQKLYAVCLRFITTMVSPVLFRQKKSEQSEYNKAETICFGLGLNYCTMITDCFSKKSILSLLIYLNLILCILWAERERFTLGNIHATTATISKNINKTKVVCFNAVGFSRFNTSCNKKLKNLPLPLRYPLVLQDVEKSSYMCWYNEGHKWKVYNKKQQKN